MLVTELSATVALVRTCCRCVRDSETNWIFRYLHMCLAISWLMTSLQISLLSMHHLTTLSVPRLAKNLYRSLILLRWVPFRLLKHATWSPSSQYFFGYSSLSSDSCHSDNVPSKPQHSQITLSESVGPLSSITCKGLRSSTFI